jgi:hypothetical protein
MTTGERLAIITHDEWTWTKERVGAHEAEIKILRRELVNIRLGIDDLSKWKEDSKVQEIAALKGQIKRYSRVRDRLLYGLGFLVLSEAARLLFDHFAQKLH